MNILIVDDDKSTRELLTELLKVNGHRVICVENGLLALDALKSGVPDLIVSDILMPGMDGFEFCQRIRSDKRLTDIPFVLLSGAFLDKKDSEFAKSIGVSHFLPKPIDPMDFTQVIEALLIQRKKKTKTNKSPRKKNARAAEDQAKLVTDKLYHKVLELDEEKASSREMEKKLRLISDSLPELMAEIDTNNCFVYVNEMYAKAYGSTQALITGKNIREVVEEEVYEIIGPKLDAALAGTENSSKLRLPLGEQGQKRYVLARFVPRQNADGRVVSVVCIFSDITHLHEVESALHEHESMLTSVLSSAPIILFAVNSDGILEVSEGESLEAIGYKPGQNIGMSAFDVFKDAPDILQDIVIALKGQQFETTISLADRILKISYTPQLDSAGNFIGTIGVAIDETKQHLLERKVMQASEAEQERISKDLHDALGQTLTGVNLLSQALQKKLSAKNLPEADDAKMISDLAADATKVAKQAIRGLSPVARMESGLLLALEDLTRTTEELHKVPCSFEHDSEITLANHQTETQLYRILQEAINNAIKHANPLRIDVSCQKKGSAHVFTVQDVPKNKINNKQKNSKGMGLNIMRYRSNMIGASLHMEMRESGTRVTCSIPEI